MPDQPVYLHRRSSHVFITTEDPHYRYEWVCAHCEYPVTLEDTCCPRCQRALEDCPVCSCLRHVRVPCVQRDAQGGRRCPACGVRRVSFGDLALAQVEGTFCTNIYGCPAGGFLLRTDEYAVLPGDATLCPVCRDAGFRPLDVRTFPYHVTHCLFCSTMYQPMAAWRPGWGKPPDVLGDLVEPAGEGLDDCALCGRRDAVDGIPAVTETRPSAVAQITRLDGTAVEPPLRAPEAAAQADKRIRWQSRLSEGSESSADASVDDYLRMAELGRLLAIEPSLRRAFPRVFGAWFGSGFDGNGFHPPPGPAISHIVGLLLEGTRLPSHRRTLQRRVTELVEALTPHFPGGAAYRIRPQGEPRRARNGR